ncbi:hypothetical protein HPB51_018690 [Rhipicephalus microplus]|uniref:Uncharacterized protein n=1 Tax=Rhipicephalus microplus TaxID=6941 RepID=A0A9J6DJ38_RHIMP|nr:hypothetical protein HPB51_018690 [Rhipicephalus microplus]
MMPVCLITSQVWDVDHALRLRHIRLRRATELQPTSVEGGHQVHAGETEGGDLRAVITWRGLKTTLLSSTLLIVAFIVLGILGYQRLHKHQDDKSQQAREIPHAIESSTPSAGDWFSARLKCTSAENDDRATSKVFTWMRTVATNLHAAKHRLRSPWWHRRRVPSYAEHDSQCTTDRTSRLMHYSTWSNNRDHASRILLAMPSATARSVSSGRRALIVACPVFAIKQSKKNANRFSERTTLQTRITEPAIFTKSELQAGTPKKFNSARVAAPDAKRLRRALSNYHDPLSGISKGNTEHVSCRCPCHGCSNVQFGASFINSSSTAISWGTESCAKSLTNERSKRGSPDLLSIRSQLTWPCKHAQPVVPDRRVRTCETPHRFRHGHPRREVVTALQAKVDSPVTRGLSRGSSPSGRAYPRARVAQRAAQVARFNRCVQTMDSALNVAALDAESNGSDDWYSSFSFSRSDCSNLPLSVTTLRIGRTGMSRESDGSSARS